MGFPIFLLDVWKSAALDLLHDGKGEDMFMDYVQRSLFSECGQDTNL